MYLYYFPDRVTDRFRNISDAEQNEVQRILDNIEKNSVPKIIGCM